MFALGVLLSILITIFLYCGWLFIILKIYQLISCSKAYIPLKIIIAFFLAIIPFHNVLVYPLIENECSLRGGTITHTQNRTYPRNISIKGNYNNLSSNQPLSDLFLKGMFESVYIDDNSSYGESSYFISAAEIHDGKAFDLRVTDISKIECGPYYSFIARYPDFSPVKSTNCIGLYRSSRPEEYIKMSKATEIENSIRTAFHTIEWITTKYDLVNSDTTTPIVELREFQHTGLELPFLLNLWSVGDFSCKAENTPDITLMKLLKLKETPPKQTAPLKDFALFKLHDLTKSFWGFEIPDKVYYYDVAVYDNNYLALDGNRLSVTLIIPKRDAPVLLQLMNDKPIDWIIRSDDDQIVLVEQFVPNSSDTVQGVPKNQIWKFDENEKKSNHLLMFFHQKIMNAIMNSIEQNRYCKMIRIPKDIATTFELDHCDNYK